MSTKNLPSHGEPPWENVPSPFPAVKLVNHARWKRLDILDPIWLAGFEHGVRVWVRQNWRQRGVEMTGDGMRCAQHPQRRRLRITDRPQFVGAARREHTAGPRHRKPAGSTLRDRCRFVVGSRGEQNFGV